MSSKNNPLNRTKSKDTLFNGKKVKPVLFINENTRYMAAAYEDGKMVMDSRTNNPIPFQSI
ncbi:MAG: hypothetical protein MK052_00825 [Alphaproteobacteria bacterium]|nr:hypothetical protein [Alphaproteobacteria bacterium]